MPYFLICHGMGGGFGGSNPDFIEKYENSDEALDVAYNLAKEEYQSYEGYHGIRSIDDINEEDFGGEDFNAAEEVYNEGVNDWIEYDAVEVYTKDGKWFYTETDTEVDMEGQEITVY